MRVIILILALIVSYACEERSERVSDAIYTQEGVAKCSKILNHPFDTTPVATTDVANLFLGTPYQGGTLDRDSTERIVVRFDSLDCTTFVETVTALTRCINRGRNDFNQFVKELEQIRYRNGKCNGYASRLHYLSEWIIDNTEKGVVKEITTPLAIEESRQIDFMSRNSDKYQGIQNNSILNEIKATEMLLSAQPFRYIPKERVAELTPETIHEGDIIAIVTDIKGLDFSHVGFATIVNGQIHLLHASSGAMRVIIDPLPLSDYLAKFKHHKGIRVVR